jgi:hypothetical protein
LLCAGRGSFRLVDLQRFLEHGDRLLQPATFAEEVPHVDQARGLPVAVAQLLADLECLAEAGFGLDELLRGRVGGREPVEDPRLGGAVAQSPRRAERDLVGTQPHRATFVLVGPPQGDGQFPGDLVQADPVGGQDRGVEIRLLGLAPGVGLLEA